MRGPRRGRPGQLDRSPARENPAGTKQARAAGPIASSPRVAPLRSLELLELQRSAGNTATSRVILGDAGMVVQRQPPVKTSLPSGKRVDEWLRASTVLQGYVAARMKKGTKAEGNVVIQSEKEFVPRLMTYLMKNAKLHEKATGKPFTRKDAEEIAPHVEAYTDDDTKKVYVNEAQCEPSTIIHEALHLFEHDALYLGVGAAAREGATEFFTLIVCGEQKIARSGYYVEELTAINRLVAVSGRKLLADAYFEGKLGPLRAAVDKAKGKGRFAMWSGHMRRGDLDKATAVLE